LRTPLNIIPPNQRPRVALRFADQNQLLVSGLLQGGGDIAQRPVVVDVPVDRGHVVLFANNPIWRGETHRQLRDGLEHDHELRQPQRRPQVGREVAMKPRVFIASMVVAVAFAGLGLAQVPAVKSALIDAPQLLKDLEVLSADDMEGRQVGTPGGAKARAYVIERFKASGIQPFGATYEQPFAFTAGRAGQQAERKGVNVVGFINGSRTPGSTSW
jgi:hypothetical protein